MRRRSTFVHDPTLDVDPHQLHVSGDKFVVDDLEAAREERLIFPLEQLPDELQQVLQRSYELHVRWASESAHRFDAPYTSRTSPGLHIFYTPIIDENTADTRNLLCPLLHKIFSSSLKCKHALITFTAPHLLSQRFSSTSSLQYHSLLPSLKAVTSYAQQNLCNTSDQACTHTVALLNIADSVDWDYDSISHALVLTARWSRPPPVQYDPLSGKTTTGGWALTVNSSPGAEKVEVGILSNEISDDPFELSLSGFLIVVGEDEMPRPTMFSFPSRHHKLPSPQFQEQQYTISFPPPTGLHPTLQISFPASSLNKLIPPANKPPGSICALHTYLTLPSPLFADKYQLSTTDALFLASHNLIALRSISGETDLEAPDYVVDKWGSNLLLELATPPSSSPKTDRDPESSSTSSPSSAAGDSTNSSEERGWNVTIPLHLRYLSPQSGGFSSVRIPWPVVFWACTAEEGTKFPVNPFDRVNLGYEGLFGPRTAFYHLDPVTSTDRAGGSAESSGGGSLVEELRVPVLDTDAFGGRVEEVVEMGTVGVVMLGFVWVCWKLWVGRARQGGVGRRGGDKVSRGVKKEQ